MSYLDIEEWYPIDVKVHVFDSSSQEFTLESEKADMVFKAMDSQSNPRISACLDCRSCVVATDPLGVLIDDLSVIYANESEFLRSFSEFIENSESVHLYFQEENDCGHYLWRDPIAFEWSSVTGEKRLHR